MHVPLRSRMQEAFTRVYDRQWFLLGTELTDFEAAYAAYNEVPYALGLSNGLDALHLALKALGIGPGMEVIVPSHTYIATVLAVSYVGATPIFAEPDPRTYNLSAAGIQSVLSPRTRAIIPVHLYGQACPMAEIMALADQHGLKVIEDNAQAHGARYRGIRTGAWGHANATSFYPGKNLGALGDSGALTLRDEALYQQVKALRNYGSEKKYYNAYIGHNMRMDELQAAFLSEKLQHLDAWTAERQRIAATYSQALEGVGDLILPYCDPEATHAYHLYVVRTEQRPALQDFLQEAGIQTLIHYPVPPHLQEAYRDLGYQRGDFPLAEALADTVLSLPLFPGMSEEQQAHVCQTIQAFFSR